jgi:hypothetical protein
LYDATQYLKVKLPSDILAMAIGGDEKDDAGSCCFELRTPLSLYFLFIHQRLQYWRDILVECGVRIKSPDRLVYHTYIISSSNCFAMLDYDFYHYIIMIVIY